MLDKEGNLADTREGIEEVITRHNENLLQRKPHSKSYEEIHNMKKKLMETLVETEIKVFKSFTINDYINVVNKVYDKKKEMFANFRDSSPKFKVLIFYILKKIYEEEDIPPSFFETKLIALFKKGNYMDPNNYRYLHIKDYLPRLFEMCLHQKLDVVFDNHTPESQAGGVKEADTVEHLVILIGAINQKYNEGKGLIISFADIVKCFDRIFLSDSHYFLMKYGADLKALKVLSILLGKNVLSLQGSSKSFTIKDGQGQGGVTTARSCAASISEVMERNSRCHPNPTVFRGENIANLGFIDDTATVDTDEIGAMFSGRLIQETFEEMSLQAHHSKTVQVICGQDEWIKDMKAKMEKFPTHIQDFKVKVTDSEKYLGLKVVSGSVSDIIDANIRLKASKVHQVTTDIRREVRDPRMEYVGSLKASALLLQSKVVPILTYATEAWLRISQSQYRAMEDIMAESITRIISLPSSTPYDALLLEMSNYHVEVWIDSMKIKYFLRKLHVKRRGKLYRTLRQEILDKDESGFIGDVRDLCRKYHLPDITMHYVTPEFVNQKCREFSRRRSMLVSLSLRKIPPMLIPGKVFNDHYTFDFMEARAITTLRTGNLIFKNWCPYKFPAKYSGDKKCLYNPCQEEDSLAHVLECPFYKTKFIEKDGPSRDWALYIISLHQERMKEFKQPLISCEGWSRRQ